MCRDPTQHGSIPEIQNVCCARIQLSKVPSLRYSLSVVQRSNSTWYHPWDTACLLCRDPTQHGNIRGIQHVCCAEIQLNRVTSVGYSMSVVQRFNSTWYHPWDTACLLCRDPTQQGNIRGIQHVCCAEIQLNMVPSLRYSLSVVRRDPTEHGTIPQIQPVCSPHIYLSMVLSQRCSLFLGCSPKSQHQSVWQHVVSNGGNTSVVGKRTFCREFRQTWRLTSHRHSWTRLFFFFTAQYFIVDVGKAHAR